MEFPDVRIRQVYTRDIIGEIFEKEIINQNNRNKEELT